MTTDEENRDETTNSESDMSLPSNDAAHLAGDPAAAPLSIRLFGPFEVRVKGSPLPRLRSRRGLWLMALLVLRLEGLHATHQRLGSESAQVLRRKAAVRLRAGVRAGTRPR